MCVLLGCFTRNAGNPYYEPAIVVYDIFMIVMIQDLVMLRNPQYMWVEYLLILQRKNYKPTSLAV